MIVSQPTIEIINEPSYEAMLEKIEKIGKGIENFAVFNFADICVTCGTIVLMFWILFFMKDEKAETK